jgi:dUTPase
MTTSLAATNDKPSVAEVEIAKHERAPVRSTVAHYVPATEEEQALDRRVNLKFDLCIILFLSLGFIVSRCHAQLSLLWLTNRL